MARIIVLGALCCCLAAVGCKGAKSEGTYDIGPDKLKSADRPPAKSLTVEFESKDNVTVMAYLVKTEDADEALKAVESGKSPEQAAAAVKPLARLEQPRGTLTTPSAETKTKWSVLLYSKKPTTVTIRTKGK